MSCPGPGIASLQRSAGPGQKIAKTTPCKVEWTPARRPVLRCVRGTVEKCSVVTAQLNPALEAEGGCVEMAIRPPKQPHRDLT
jgi:hypothetical protein